MPNTSQSRKAQPQRARPCRRGVSVLWDRSSFEGIGTTQRRLRRSLATGGAPLGARRGETTQDHVDGMASRQQRRSATCKCQRPVVFRISRARCRARGKTQERREWRGRRRIRSIPRIAQVFPVINFTAWHPKYHFKLSRALQSQAISMPSRSTRYS